MLKYLSAPCKSEWQINSGDISRFQASVVWLAFLFKWNPIQNYESFWLSLFHPIWLLYRGSLKTLSTTCFLFQVLFVYTFLRDDREGRFLLRRIDEHSNMPQVTGLKFEIWFCLNIFLICVWNASVFCVVCLYLSCQWNIFFSANTGRQQFQEEIIQEGEERT